MTTTATKSTFSLSHAACTFAHLYTERRLLELLAQAADAVDDEDLDLGDLLDLPAADGRGPTWSARWTATGPVGIAEAYVIAELAEAGDVDALKALIATTTQAATQRRRPGKRPAPYVLPDGVYQLAVQAWTAWTADAVTGFDADELLDLGADRVDLARWLAAARDRGPWSATGVLALHIAGIAD
ncbi:hypothetical protein [Mycobacteroides immunogenum]|uniref:Uncharacterized protein n=1 Tax=Mycobacteroides immunogenum TaxID=83262 RepID=A0ABR5LKK4_9MYCO|nr:hypothetical protein [Mycobacteroides immunogenum]KPG26240.1 hypothetical protein AN912_25700 [Mycobacteroides immunogenum]KPG26314.1 hypothetical protein AN913_21385 [Mycobacteroides immunogenum]KPG31814.1 hypothetical protein AN914_25920 [Mycobacteroides immunogenum]KPG39709.1 hypothetical protein AN915_26630 [Mycobacteroides immunogenum]KPG57285.1 hypothetical protein AN918_26450 [Mycobacteroides immunogenum]